MLSEKIQLYTDNKLSKETKSSIFYKSNCDLGIFQNSINNHLIINYYERNYYYAYIGKAENQFG